MPLSGKLQPTENTSMRSDLIFETLAKGIPEKARHKVPGIICFRVKRGNNIKVWTIDMTDNTVTPQLPATKLPTTTFLISDEDMVLFSRGQTSLRTLFMRNKLHIDGDYAYAVKFTSDLMPKLALL